MEISIVTTLYQSAPHLEDFYRRMSDAAQRLTPDYEIIFVNDGSPDNSLNLAVSLHEQDSRVRVIDLSRNFGHHKAMMTGLSYAQGQLVFLIDCDLEEEPELLTRFFRDLAETGADVVYGVQRKRSGSLARVVTGKLFYTLFNMLSPERIPPNVLTVRLMRADYVRAILQYREREFIISGVWAAAGFRQHAIPVDKTDKGRSSYGFLKRATYTIDAITSFSNRPLYAVFYLGLLIFVISVVSALYLIVQRIFFQTMMSGWPSLMVSVWLLGGLALMCVGVVGIYLSKVFTEVKQRPFTLVRKVYGDAEQQPGAPS